MGDAVGPPSESPPVLSERAEREIAFIFDACRHFGASLYTAHRVCAVVAQSFEAMERKRRGDE